MVKQRRVLLVGGSGFIGSHVTRALQEAGWQPVVMDWVEPRIEGVEYHGGDFRTLIDLMPGLVEQADAVCLLAWTTKPQSANDDPLYDLETNVLAGLHFLDGFARLSKQPPLIFLSTGGAVYGAPIANPVKEDGAMRPLNAYGISKWTFEQYLRLYRRLYDIDYRILRPGNPFGEWQNPEASQGAAAVFLGRVARGQPIEVWGDGSVVRDYLYIGDLADAVVRAIEYQPGEKGPRTFNIGSGEGIDLRQLIERIARVTGKQPQVRYTPARKTDVPEIVLDCRLARHHLNWKPRIPFDQALSRTWEWIRQEMAC